MSNNIIWHWAGSILKKDGKVLLYNGFFWEGNAIGNFNNLFKEFLHSKIRIPQNGQFSFVFINKDKVFACTDIVRSYPVFYSVNKTGIFLSDNARILEKYVDKSYGQNAINEFRYSGFTSGNKTLNVNIKQLLPGCILEGVYNQGIFEYSTTSYFKYITYPESVSITHLPNKHNRLLKQIFKRLISYANGKTLLIPLSGGIDSRLIVSELKKLNYKNVICYSYGKKGNLESIKSQEIAKKLGYIWHFIEYSNKKWRNFKKSNVFKQYFQFADNLSSLPHIQDLLAVYELKKNKIIPDDSIIIPGHTGDFISGGHVPQEFINPKNQNIEFLSKKIIGKHFRLLNFKNSSTKEQLAVKTCVTEFIQYHPEKMDHAFLMELFDWQERQSKFIVNSVRAYDFFKYSWYLPLWDRELVDFWLKIPLTLKVKKTLYLILLKKHDEIKLFEDIPYASSSLSESVKKTNILDLKQLVKSKINSLKKKYIVYFNDKMGWYGIYDYLTFLRKRNNYQNINSFLVETYLKKNL